MALAEREAAWWLLGHDAAMRGRVPSWHAITKGARAEYLAAVRTARDLVNGGTFNPLLIWAMAEVVKRGLRDAVRMDPEQE